MENPRKMEDDHEAVTAITGRLSRAKDLLQRYEQEAGINILCHLPRLMTKELV